LDSALARSSEGDPHPGSSWWLRRDVQGRDDHCNQSAPGVRREQDPPPLASGYGSAHAEAPRRQRFRLDPNRGSVADRVEGGPKRYRLFAASSLLLRWARESRRGRVAANGPSAPIEVRLRQSANNEGGTVTIEEKDAWVSDAVQEARGRFNTARQISHGDVSEFVESALGAAGVASADGPRLVFDLPLDHPIKGLFDPTDLVIHLGADDLDAWNVLHMLAHWLTSTDEHGEPWRRQLIQLVATVIGEDEADELSIAFQIWKPIPPGAVHHSR